MKVNIAKIQALNQNPKFVMILIQDPNKGWWHTLWEYWCVHNIINNLQSNENIEYIDDHPQPVFQEHELHTVLCRQQNTCVICFKACSLNCYCLFGVSVLESKK